MKSVSSRLPEIRILTVISTLLKVKQSPVNKHMDHSPGFQIVLLQSDSM